MTDAPNILSPSFPNGLPKFRTEAEYRAQKLQAPLACPFCGEDPGLARQVHNRFIVGCESDDCHVCPQVSGDTVSEAWARWNKRASPPQTSKPS